MFIDGYLALATAVGAGSITECALTGYARQPISFGEPQDGIAFSANPYTFGQAVRSGAVGRAIFDAPSAGNLLLVMPFPTPIARDRLPWDSGETSHIRLFFTALQQSHRGAAYTGRIAAAAMAGLCSDANDIISRNDITQSLGNPRPLINTAMMTAGVALSINRGVLQASSLVPAGTE